MKVVINKCFGGFDVSPEAYRIIADRKGWIVEKDDWGNCCWRGEKQGTERSYLVGSDLDRTDSDLIQVVEVLKDQANGRHSELAVVEIPDGIDWYIGEYDGLETIHERHRTWS